MTIKITRGPKWIAHCASSSKEKKKDCLRNSKGIEFTLMETELRRKNIITQNICALNESLLTIYPLSRVALTNRMCKMKTNYKIHSQRSALSKNEKSY